MDENDPWLLVNASYHYLQDTVYGWDLDCYQDYLQKV